MKQGQIDFELANKISQSNYKMYLANWEMFNQAIFHPMVNAVKFNKSGGSIKVQLSAKESEKYAFIQCMIRDEGIGIAPENL